MTPHTFATVIIRLVGFGILIYTLLMAVTTLFMGRMPLMIYAFYSMQLIIGIALSVFAKPLARILTSDLDK